MDTFWWFVIGFGIVLVISGFASYCRHKEVRGQGGTDFWRGVRLADNPYLGDSTLAWEWHEGWLEAKRQADVERGI